MEININIKGPSIRILRKFLWALLLGGLFALIFWFVFNKLTDNNPLPASIQKQLEYPVAYPDADTIDLATVQYQSTEKTLSYVAKIEGEEVVVTQQPSAESLADGSQILFQALGLRPYAQFQSKHGPVALAKFYETATLAPKGQSAVLTFKKTLLVATPKDNKELSNQQWKDFFDNLKVDD